MLTNYELTQSILNGWFPYERIDQWHKHICVFRFKRELPAIIGSLHQQKSILQDVPLQRNKLGFCNADNLPAIIARWEKNNRLQEKYGERWLHYYDE